MHFKLYSKTFFTILLVLILASVISPVEAEDPRENAMKAGFLLNFGRFVKWPQKSLGEKTINYCIVEPNPFKGLSDDFNSRRVRNREVRLLVINSHQLELINDCHVLFMPKKATLLLTKKIVSKASKLPVLTVSDGDKGAIITLFEKDNKLRFAIDINLSEKAGLDISSKLLNLAIIKSKP